jgi:glucans biosynthesis protein
MNQAAQTRLSRIRAAPRCGAKTRAGTSCRCPAIRGRIRCRLHGGLSPGAPKGSGNGNFKDGFWTCEAMQERRWAKQMLKAYTKATNQ